MALELPEGHVPLEVALEYAYPGADLDLSAGTFRTPDGVVIPYFPARDVSASTRLDSATLGDMFTYLYPLDFNLGPRQTAVFDPGRVRDEAFFRAMYFAAEGDARATLQTVAFEGQTLNAPFAMTSKYCVSTQLAAALAQIETLSPGMDVYFDQVGGSFNWRVIAGTERLSSHSFGTALDYQHGSGGYWRWIGLAEGQVTDYDNKIPAVLVQALERFAFNWGGKWNHFDGMHFEYRPELILYARLMD